MTINTLGDLMRAVSDTITAGYFADVKVSPRTARSGDFLIVAVESNEPNSFVQGEWWFDADNSVMQVL